MQPEEEVIQPLFLGMTRPAMVWGVTFTYFVLELMASGISFLATGELPWVLIFFPAHLIGYIFCIKDPNKFEVLWVKYYKCMQCLNREFWGGINSYSPW